MGDVSVSVCCAVPCGAGVCCVCFGACFLAGVWCSGDCVHLGLVGVVLDECAVEVVGVAVVHVGVCFAVACGSGVCGLSGVLDSGECLHLGLVGVVFACRCAFL